MRKAIIFSLLALLLVSCEKEEPTIYGKWKLEYAKNITPAIYDFLLNRPVYGDGATISEYFGDYNKYDISWVDRMEITKDSVIWSYRYLDEQGAEISFSYGYPFVIGAEFFFIRNPSDYHDSNPKTYYKYVLEKNTFVLEAVKVPQHFTQYYFYGKYSRMK